MEKTEPPSPRRLKKARAAGDVPVSPVALRAAPLLVVLALGPAAARATSEWFRTAFRAALATGGAQAGGARALGESFATLAFPLLAAMTAAALAAGLAQTGGVVALPRGGPDRPRRTLGLGRLFDGARTASLLVGLVTATLMVAFAGQATLDWLPSVATLLDVPQRAPEVTGSGLSRILLVAAAVVATCAAGDWLVRRELWLRRHRMSREELRRERREEEGAPEMRRARERLHEGLARGDVREGQRVGPRRDHPGPR